MNANLINTDKLLQLLKNNPDELEKIQFDEDAALKKLLEDAMKKEDISIAKLIVRTGLSKPYVYQMFEGSRNPGRNALLRISFALRLLLPDIQRLLSLSGKCVLYPKVRRDAAIIASLAKNLSIDETDEFLRSIGEESLL